MENDNQLIELKTVSQNEKDISRRKFINGNTDLVVWCDLKNTIIGFQITYNEIVITCSYNQFSISSIDSSEKDNYSQILVGSPEVNLQNVIDYIDHHGSMIDSEVIEYMKAVLLKKL